MVIGYYDIASKKQSDVICENGFYISSGLPAVIDNSVILPITLNTNEHKLMMINTDSNTSEMIFNEFNSYPIDSVATMNTSIYMLSSKKDNSTATSYIRKYNENTNEMDICIEKEFTDNTGEQIKAFACNNEKIYVMVNQIETENDIYIEIYDDKNYDGMKKTYVIWILPQAAKKRDGHVNCYKTNEHNISGSTIERLESYDKSEQIMIYLNKDHDIKDKYEDSDWIKTPLVIFLNNTYDLLKKKEIMKEYGFEKIERRLKRCVI